MVYENNLIIKIKISSSSNLKKSNGKVSNKSCLSAGEICLGDNECCSRYCWRHCMRGSCFSKCH